ncbi:vacuolar protein sorting 16B [Oratosquilla oratoria]|uniref:vacuolar protein sorting 16B n=1 Tax=Oratosquilla oratoria TaxID=337810 RepID=UPI003F757EA2
MSSHRSENDAYWGASQTASKSLDTFFDEDCDNDYVASSFSIMSLSSKTSSSSRNTTEGSSSSGQANVTSSPSMTVASRTSIMDNIATPTDSPVVSSKITKGVSKTLGEKLDSWKPPSVSIKWNNSQGSGTAGCDQCAAKEDEILQLKKRLEKAYSRHNITLPPEDIIHRIMRGQPYSLESYRSLSDKLALIDCALSTMDGSAIFATVIHLKKTVNKSIFHQEMTQRPMASQLYVTYLKNRNQISEAIEFLGVLGKTEDAAILKYKAAVSSKGTENKIKNIKNALQTHFSDSSLSFAASLVKDHITLLERQLPIEEADNKDNGNPLLESFPRPSSLPGKPILTTLYYCCMYHWGISESHLACPTALKKAHNLTDKQFLWTVIRARARVKLWPLPSELDDLMGSKGILGTLGALSGMSSGTGRAVKAALSVDRVVDILAESGAPSQILSLYIGLIDSVETKMKLAVNYKCHQAIIDIHIAQRDREALEKFMKELDAGTPDYIKAENALKTTKWKN